VKCPKTFTPKSPDRDHVYILTSLEQAAKTIDVIVADIDEDVGTLIDIMPSVYGGHDFKTIAKKLDTSKQAWGFSCYTICR
jgi:hypothetical protein